MTTREDGSPRQISVTELTKDYKKYEDGTVLNVLDKETKEPISQPGTENNLKLEIFTNQQGKKAIRILGEDNSVLIEAFGRNFPFSLATMIFDTDKIVDSKRLDYRIYFDVETQREKVKEPDVQSQLSEQPDYFTDTSLALAITPTIIPKIIAKKQVEPIIYLEKQQLIDFWGNPNNEEILNRVLEFTEAAVQKKTQMESEELVDYLCKIYSDFNLHKEYLRVKPSGPHDKTTNTIRLRSFLNFLRETITNLRQIEVEGRIADEKVRQEKVARLKAQKLAAQAIPETPTISSPFELLKQIEPGIPQVVKDLGTPEKSENKLESVGDLAPWINYWREIGDAERQVVLDYLKFSHSSISLTEILNYCTNIKGLKLDINFLKIPKENYAQSHPAQRLKFFLETENFDSVAEIKDKKEMEVVEDEEIPVPDIEDPEIKVRPPAVRVLREGKFSWTGERLKNLSLAVHIGYSDTQMVQIFGTKDRHAIIGARHRNLGRMEKIISGLKNEGRLEIEIENFKKLYPFSVVGGRRAGLWSEARKIATRAKNAVRNLFSSKPTSEQTSRGANISDPVYAANLAKRVAKKAEVKANTLKKLQQATDYYLGSENNRILIVDKLAKIFRYLKGERNDQLTLDLIAIKINTGTKTIRREGLTTYNPEQDLVDTITITIKIETSWPEEKKAIYKGLWLLLKQELAKLKDEQNSRLGEFFKTDEHGNISNRILLKYEEKVTSTDNKIGTEVADLTYFPPKDEGKVAYKLNYDGSVFPELFEIQEQKVLPAPKTNGPTRRANRISEQPDYSTRIGQIALPKTSISEKGALTSTAFPLSIPEKTEQIFVGERPRYFSEKLFVTNLGYKTSEEIQTGEEIERTDEEKRRIILERSKFFFGFFLLHEISKHFKISEANILSDKRSSEFVLPRHIFCYYLVDKLGIGWSEVENKYIDLDHASVMNAVKGMRSRLDENSPDFVSKLATELDLLFEKSRSLFEEYLFKTNKILQKLDKQA